MKTTKKQPLRTPVKHIKWALLLVFALTCNLLPAGEFPMFPSDNVEAAEGQPGATYTPEYVLDELFPGLPPYSTEYAASYDELTAEQKQQVKDNAYYLQGEDNHGIRALTGSLVQDSERKAQITRRAEFTLKDVDTDWAARLSSDNTIHVRMFSGATWHVEYQDIEKNDGANISLLCLYGDKAEKWFLGMGGELRPRVEMEGTWHTPQYTYGASYETQTGYLEYDPIVTATKEYIDRMITDDIGILHIFVHYADEELLYPEALQLQLDGMDYTIDLDDIKHNMAFKSGLVSWGNSSKQREIYEPKINAIYNDENDYDPFLDPDSTPSPETRPEGTAAPTAVPTAEPTEPPVRQTAEPTAAPSAESTGRPTAVPTGTPAPADTITVFIDGEQVDVEQKLMMVNDHVLIPMRAVFEKLGAAVSWENETRTVTAVRDGTTIILRIGEEWFTKDGTVMDMDVPSIIYHDRTYVPLRAVSEALERTVSWDDATKTVTIE